RRLPDRAAGERRASHRGARLTSAPRRAAAVRVEEREVATRHRVPRYRCAWVLGAQRLSQHRRSLERAALLGRRLNDAPAGLDFSWPQIVSHDGPCLVFVTFAIAAVAALWIPLFVMPALFALLIIAVALWARAGRIRRLARDGIAVPGRVEWTSGEGEEMVLGSALGGFRRRAIVSYEFEG